MASDDIPSRIKSSSASPEAPARRPGAMRTAKRTLRVDEDAHRGANARSDRLVPQPEAVVPGQNRSSAMHAPHRLHRCGQQGRATTERFGTVQPLAFPLAPRRPSTAPWLVRFPAADGWRRPRPQLRRLLVTEVRGPRSGLHPFELLAQDRSDRGAYSPVVSANIALKISLARARKNPL